MTGHPRPAVAALPAYRPGRSAEMAEVEHGISDAIKLASNELPFGPLPSVAGAIAAGTESIQLYADHRATALREDLAAHLGLAADQVTIGAGSVGLLQQLFLTYCDPGDEVVMCWPSFEALPVFSMLVGAEQVRVPLREETFDLPAMAAVVTDRTRLAFVTTPNNPTGTVVGTDEIVALCEAVPAGCLVVVDEAYAEFVDDPRVRDATELVERFDHVVVTRTFSKAHGLAGLRVGYAFGHPAVIEMVDRTLAPFLVNELAQRAARASLGAADEMAARVATVVAERRRVAAALRERGWSVPDPQGNFVWLPVREVAADLAVELERRGVVTRPFADVGVRITIGDATANDRLLAAIDDQPVTPR